MTSPSQHSSVVVASDALNSSLLQTWPCSCTETFPPPILPPTSNLVSSGERHQTLAVSPTFLVLSSFYGQVYLYSGRPLKSCFVD